MTSRLVGHLVGTTASYEKCLSGNVAGVTVSKESGRNSMVECQLPKPTWPTFSISTYKIPQ
jgi:hypothetical protein